jgi:hypothetical protein
VRRGGRTHVLSRYAVIPPSGALFAPLRLTVSNSLEHVRFMVEQHFIPKAILVDELFAALRGARGN